MSKPESQTGVIEVQPCETTERTEAALFGAGCFWGVEAAFAKLDGVVETAVGYSGGESDYPSYEHVCTGSTNHAEVVRVVYDPAKVSYSRLVEVFFDIHDPTQLNRQGPDHGTQYRSVIYYCTADQQQAAVAIRDRLDAADQFPRPIVTQIDKAGTFWRAEEYHQQYLAKNRFASCHI